MQRKFAQNFYLKLQEMADYLAINDLPTQEIDDKKFMDDCRVLRHEINYLAKLGDW
jgi:hypothetical protein